MTRAWRLSRRKFAKNAFEGIGAARYGARWNPPGRAVVYTSENLSLACLEFVVHLDVEDLPRGLIAIPAMIPDTIAIERVEEGSLPRGWRRYPFPRSLQRIGAEWLARGRSAVLSVPSVVVPIERNLLINPAHPDARLIVVEASVPFSLDSRLKGRA